MFNKRRLTFTDVTANFKFSLAMFTLALILPSVFPHYLHGPVRDSYLPQNTNRQVTIINFDQGSKLLSRLQGWNCYGILQPILWILPPIEYMCLLLSHLDVIVLVAPRNLYGTTTSFDSSGLCADDVSIKPIFGFRRNFIPTFTSIVCCGHQL